jgi:hypothetical protein
MLLNTLLNTDRMARVVNTAAVANASGQPYTLNEMLSSLGLGIWSELSSNPIKTEVYRRNLQRSYIEAMGNKLNPPPFTPPAGLPPGFTLLRRRRCRAKREP